MPTSSSKARQSGHRLHVTRCTLRLWCFGLSLPSHWSKKKLQFLSDKCADLFGQWIYHTIKQNFILSFLVVLAFVLFCFLLFINYIFLGQHSLNFASEKFMFSHCPPRRFGLALDLDQGGRWHRALLLHS